MPEPIASVWDKKGNSVLEKGRHFNGFDKISHDIKAIKKMRALYHGSIKFIDDEIKRITDFLKAENLFSNTIYVFTTDHGDMMGDHALITKGVKFFDKGIRIPLIISGAGISGGKECSSLSCSLDLFPTFCAWAGAKSLPPLEGKSLAPICLGKTQDTPWKEVTIEAPCYPAELVKAGAENGVRGIVTADNWRFTIFDEDNTGEMFNLSKDPCEQNNLFYNPDYTEKKLFLFERLTRAFMQAASVQQYRNLPAANGKKFIIGPGIQNFNGEVYQR
ncbi:MAG TPA: hypothetical protein DC049_11180 [Spirochaetia bacterium]|nr:hypothetical protein [Spirochaetia bacterium]